MKRKFTSLDKVLFVFSLILCLSYILLRMLAVFNYFHAQR